MADIAAAPPPDDAPAEAPQPASDTTKIPVMKVLLAIGAVAGAIATIVGLGTTIGGWLKGSPPGVVTSLALQGIRPLTYGEWRTHENVSLAGVPTAQLGTPGRLITYKIETKGFKNNTRLPVRITVHDVSQHVSRREDGTIKVTNGDVCSCVDWVPVPPGRGRYYVEIAVFPPGPVAPGQQSLGSADTEAFAGSG